MGFTTPAAYGLLADAFPRGSQATANSLYASGVYLGGGLASLSALLVASVRSLPPLTPPHGGSQRTARPKTRAASPDCRHRCSLLVLSS